MRCCLMKNKMRTAVVHKSSDLSLLRRNFQHPPMMMVIVQLTYMLLTPLTAVF